MKAVHHNKQPGLSKTELLKEAKDAEADNDWKEAETLYKEVIKIDPHNEPAYNRLMMICRKQKEPNKELQVVKKAIHSFEDMYASTSKTSADKKVSRISNALLKAMGLADKKGKPLYLPGPLAKWKKRKDVLEKKLKKL